VRPGAGRRCLPARAWADRTFNDPSSLREDAAISSTAASNATLLCGAGTPKPLIFLTNCLAAACTSSSDAAMSP